MRPVWASIAIGGTRCSVAVAADGGETFSFPFRVGFDTAGPPEAVLEALVAHLANGLATLANPPLAGIGIVCGGPLDEQKGLVLGPPNLPGWQSVEVLSRFERRFDRTPRLQNDANAGAVAEWVWGAARGAGTAVFLTCGTGLGAGLILDGRLFAGPAGLAGELGHWRLAPDGPVGYGKAGSFEGFCAGSGIARQAQERARARLQEGRPTALARSWDDLAGVSARSLADAADAGDGAALRLWTEIGRRLGAGLALLVDLLTPEVIVLGGIYARQRRRLEPSMLEELESEALPQALAACRIVPSALGEDISEWSGLAAALVGDDTTAAGRLISGGVAAPPPGKRPRATGRADLAAVPTTGAMPKKMEEDQ